MDDNTREIAMVTYVSPSNSLSFPHKSILTQVQECPAPQPRNKKTFATPKDAQHALDPAGTAFKSRRSSAMPFESSMSSSPSSSPAMTSELSNLSAEVEKLQRMAGSWTDDKGVSGDGMASSATVCSRHALPCRFEARADRYRLRGPHRRALF